MKNIRFITTVKPLLSTVFLGALWLSQAGHAQTRVVVIPLFGDDVPAVSHPAAAPFINSLGMQFNTLPAGSFIMGSPIGEPGKLTLEDEHTVTLTKAFGMQVTEVTNAQWNEVIVDSSVQGINPSSSHTQANERGDHPVDSVSWFDAVFFANQLSTREGRSACYTFSGQSGIPGSNLSISSVTSNANCTGYRLPTEAEWEYAARAGSTNAYANPISFDDSDTETRNGFNSNLHAMGWYLYNDEMQNASGVTAYESGTKPVAKKQANAWGLYDMHGNVWEWGWDFLGIFSGAPETDPTGPETGSSRVLRGGAWARSADESRSARRNGTQPTSFDTRFGKQLGFRLVFPKVQ